MHENIPTLVILEDIVNKDEHRIIRFLLSNTIIDTKIIVATEKKPFFSNVGTPQGDSLSPVLFTIYLEHALKLKEVRPVLLKPSTPLEKVLPREIAYADDVDFVAFQDIDIEEVGKVLEKHNLQVNVDETEFTNLSRGETNWQTTKKVCTLIGDQEDIERRKQLSTAALVKLKNVWLKGDKITKKTKLKLYKALVKSVFTYNCGKWAPTQSQEERLNAFHRKQLKKVLNIKYPVKITNSSLYNKCNKRPLSIFILESRWRLFGHLLRRDSQIPANQAMSRYFVTEGSKFKGHPLTTLPVVLNRDLSRIINSNLQLKSSHDLEHLRYIAQQRDEWTKLTARIREAAEASQSEH
ncbi:hypothetical protein ElyMa_004664100 [Elysia marginata]|uniref:Reverse transcriptase domain-containing protein n=1 Tax=Elysia marginata TaxID=1093978 RepID=A0AAV4I2R7_9GAST|nr:hypothetical protein ElyMa_004664100 [Elysia marginata]